MNNKQIASLLFAAIAAVSCLVAPLQAQAHAESASEASAALSMLPLASVVGAASVAGATASTVAAVPAALSVAGAVLVVKAVEVTVEGTVYLLERASDGARASVKVAGRAVNGASLAAGTVVTVSVIGSGMLLSAAGEVIAFLPNALGRALLHNERLM